MILTVKDLREKLAELPDETQLICFKNTSSGIKVFDIVDIKSEKIVSFRKDGKVIFRIDPKGPNEKWSLIEITDDV